MFKYIMTFTLLAVFSTLGFAQEAGEAASGFGWLPTGIWEWTSVITAAMLFFQAVARKTETKVDDKVYEVIYTITSYLGLYAKK